MRNQTLTRKLRVMLVAATYGLLAAMTAHGAIIQVNAFTDVIVEDSECTLREAIVAANTNADFNGCVLQVDDTLPPGLDVITLPEGTYTLTIPPEGDDETGAPEVLKFGEYTLTWQGGDALAYSVTVTPDETKGDLDVMESIALVGLDGGAVIDGGWRPLNPVTDLNQDPGDNPAGFGDRVFHVIARPVAAAAPAQGGEEEEPGDVIDIGMANVTVTGGKLNWKIFLGPDPANPDGDLIDYYFRRDGGGLAAGGVAAAADRKSTRLNSSHSQQSRMPSFA